MFGCLAAPHKFKAVHKPQNFNADFVTFVFDPPPIQEPVKQELTKEFSPDLLI